MRLRLRLRRLVTLERHNQINFFPFSQAFYLRVGRRNKRGGGLLIERVTYHESESMNWASEWKVGKQGKFDNCQAEFGQWQEGRFTGCCVRVYETLAGIGIAMD